MKFVVSLKGTHAFDQVRSSLICCRVGFTFLPNPNLSYGTDQENVYLTNSITKANKIVRNLKGEDILLISDSLTYNEAFRKEQDRNRAFFKPSDQLKIFSFGGIAEEKDEYFTGRIPCYRFRNYDDVALLVHHIQQNGYNREELVKLFHETYFS